MDDLSRILERVRCEGARFIEVELGAPWSVRSTFGQDGLVERLPSASHLVSVCFVADGSCHVGADGGVPDPPATRGDLLLFSGPQPYRIGSHLHVAPLEEADTETLPASGDVAPAHRVRGGSGAITRLVIGAFACSPGMVRPLLATLPPCVRLHGGDGVEPSGLSRLLRIGVQESRMPRPGVDSVLARLGELVLVDALRRHADQAPSAGQGWLAAFRDERIGRALALMHAEPGRAWTLDELARSVALSRSALADRFARLVGQPPMRYLTRWRLALAAQALRSGAEAIVRVAERAGYDSDAAFNRAFQREFGMPPARWRRRAALA